MQLNNLTVRTLRVKDSLDVALRNEPRRKTLATKVIRLALFALIVLIMVLGYEKTAQAAEGGASHYLPGAAGDVWIAQSPKPGLQVAMTLWGMTGDVNTAVLQGRVGVSLDLDLYLAIPTAFYTFEEPVLGGTYTMGIAVPFGYANLDAQLIGPLGNALTRV